MQTKDDLIMYVVTAHVVAGQNTDAEKKTGYGDRFVKASKIVLTGGIKATSRGEYDVHSGTDANIMYHVNGTCECQDWKNWVHHERWLKDHQGKDVTSFAPKGFCKHRLAVVIWGKVQAKLKWTAEQRIVHAHRWNCTTHRDVPIECWQHACPDAIDIACPTCVNVPAQVEQIITDEGTPTETDIVHPDDQPFDPTTGEILEEQQTMMSTIGETIIGVMSSLHTNGQTTDPEYVTEEENGPVPTLTGEPEAVAEIAQPPVIEELPPLAEPTRPPMPEAPVSFYIKCKVDNFELSYTMRAHTDSEVIARLPGVLAGLENVLKIEVDHDEPFLKRLLHAFFPKPSRYTGK